MKKDELWAFDWKFWLVLILLVMVCTEPRAQHKPVLLIWQGCDGKAKAAQVHITWSDLPAFTCAHQIAQYDALQGAGMLMGVALACSYYVGNEAYMVLPYNASPALITHEVGHITGAMWHPPLVPIAEVWCSPDETEVSGASSVSF